MNFGALEIEEIVLPGDVEAEPRIKRRGPRVFILDKELNRLRVFQQLSTDFRQTTLSQALTSFFRADIHAFDVSGVRCAR